MNAQTQTNGRTGSLSTKAMLASVSISQWTARKLDKGATRDIAADAGASSDAVALHKRLLKKTALARIASSAGAARNLFYELTLPWLDDGARILPAGNFYRYRDAMADCRHEFEAAVAEFLSTYDAAVASHIEESKRELGQLWKASDYPSRDDVARKFSFGFRILPFPDAGDFRVDLSAGQLEDIRREIEADTRSALDGAVQDTWKRVADVCSAMVERLGAYQPAQGSEKAVGVFRDSLVENVRGLVDLLPALNLTGDATLAAITERMKESLCQFDAKELRESDNARAKVAKEAKAILDDVADYLA